jgi:hypothetical protein
MLLIKVMWKYVTVFVVIVFNLGLWGTEARMSCGGLESCSLCVRRDGCGKARSAHLLTKEIFVDQNNLVFVNTHSNIEHPY